MMSSQVKPFASFDLRWPHLSVLLWSSVWPVSCISSRCWKMCEMVFLSPSHPRSMRAAVGPSIAADVRQVDRAGAKQPESKLDVLVRAHGVSRDVAERYLMACDDKLGDTHKMLQASRVTLPIPPRLELLLPVLHDRTPVCSAEQADPLGSLAGRSSHSFLACLLKTTACLAL